jgi:hypothetical protein
MIKVFFFLLRLFFESRFRDKDQLLAENLILRKELAILGRQQKGTVKTTRSEKRFFAFLAKIQVLSPGLRSDQARDRFSLVQKAHPRSMAVSP